VSAGGGLHPVWSAGGRAWFYLPGDWLSPARLVVAPLDPRGPTF
jgi:hypothetical protein